MPSPFKLFEPYTASDKEVFFGRDAEIYALYNLLQQTRLVLIYGASGTGKTSVIQAGLPKVFKLTDWFRISVRWRDNINVSLRNELGKLMEDSGNITSLGEAITEIYEDRWIPIYLVFDQFEEVFTLGSHEERLTFFQDIQQLLDKSLPCKIIFSMREEYIGHLYEYEYIVPSLFDKRFRIEAMKDGTVHTVLDEMVHEFTKEATRKTIIQKIFEQLKEGKQAVHLPYLQVYLHYLYEYSAQVSSKVYFTEASIEAIGKLGNVIKRFIETISNEAQTRFTQWGLPNTFAADLLDEFATAEGTKQAGKVAELANKLESNEKVTLDALQYFTEQKLLRADENDVHRYEPVHDVVAMQIHELRSVENKDFKAFLRQLQNDCERWLNEAKSEARLLVESDVAKADVYQERLKKRPEFVIWKDYVEQSRVFNNHRLEEEKRKNEELQSALFTSKRNANWAIGVAILAILFAVGAYYFYSKVDQTLVQVEEEQTKNKRIIDAFYFYGDSLALAVKNEFGEYKYGFINKEGKVLIEYKYDEATSFNQSDGYARVKKGNVKYLLDPKGREYPLAQTKEEINPSVTAVDLHDQKLDSIPSFVFQNPQLRVLLLYQNYLNYLPPQIGSLTSLQTLDLRSNPQLKEIPKALWSLTSLQKLSLSDNDSLSNLPKEIGSLTSLQTLSLSGTSLSNLPKALWSLTSLQTLSLRGTSLSNLPKEIGSLTSLQTLDLRGTSLSNLPKEIGSLTSLQTLDLSFNAQLKEIPKALWSLTSLQTLFLGGTSLSNLPKEIESLTSLQTLSLRGTSLSNLPKEIGSLTSLQTLYLSDNDRLSNLPKEIGSLTSLQTLSLGGTSLSNLPKEIGSLTSLQTLDLSRTSLSSLPAEIVKLTSLQKLYLSETSLSNLPKEIGSLTSLQTLDLSRTSLSNLPKEIGSLTSLQTLFLGGTSLSNLPKEIGSLTSLQTLDLSRTSLSNLPKEIGSLTSLQTLDLSETSLSNLPKEIGSLTSLQTLYLSDNHSLSNLPKEIGSLTSLQTLDLSRTSLSNLPKEIGSLTSLQTLSLSETSLSNLPKEIGSLTSLQTLDLGGTSLSNLPKEIGSLTSLQTLDLSRTSLSNLPKEIGSLTSLQTLDLSRTSLSNLPKEIGSLTSLQTLYLSDNDRLSNLPKEIGSLTSLQTLSLGGTSLSNLPKEIGSLTSLQTLYLSNCPISEVEKKKIKSWLPNCEIKF